MIQTNYSYPVPPPYRRPSGMSTAALVMGILSLPSICILGIGGFIFGGLGILFAVLSRDSTPMETNAKIGLGLSIAGIVLSCIIFLIIIGISTFQTITSPDNFRQFQIPYENEQLPFEDFDDFKDYYNDYRDNYDDTQTVPEIPWRPL